MKAESYQSWALRQCDRGIDADAALKRLCAFTVETPSWGYADSGTRFKVFRQPGAARTLEEKLQDAAQVHRFTGACPSVAIHIPWDKCDDYGKALDTAAELGLTIGAVNPNLFQDDDYKLGSLCNSDKSVRAMAVAHVLECVDIAAAVNSKDISLWLSDGTNYPGQDDIVERKRRLEEALREIYAAMGADMRLLIEYKGFEPAFYHTDIADWGMSLSFARKLGARAQVLVDIGHHAPGVNVEHIVAFLLDEGALGGFHFNDRRYADDDLIVGSIDPYALFRIFHQLMAAEGDARMRACARQVAYMIDQSHNIEPKIPAMIQSVVSVQTACAKALLIDHGALRAAQRSGDVLGAMNCLREAFEQDVSPLLIAMREQKDLEPDPLAAYLRGGYEQLKRLARA